MNDKFDKVMSKVGLFLGGVVATIVGITIIGVVTEKKEHETEGQAILKALEKSFDDSEKVINQEEA